MYPWDCVVSFVLRYFPHDRPRENVRILEVGCGTAANLWFAAREGFNVTGIDQSAEAISSAKRRFQAEGLPGELHVGSFTALPFPDSSFDLIIDRAALTCVELPDLNRAVQEISRVTRPGGYFFMNTYGDGHTSAYSHRATGTGTVIAPDTGSLAGLDRITFLTEKELRTLLSNRWSLQSLQRVEHVEQVGNVGERHVEWRAVAKRRSDSAE